MLSIHKNVKKTDLPSLQARESLFLFLYLYKTFIVVLPKDTCTQFKKSNCSFCCETLSPSTSPSQGQLAVPFMGIIQFFPPGLWTMCLHYPFILGIHMKISFPVLRPSHPLILPKSLHRILLIPLLSVYVAMSKEMLFTDKTRDQEHLFLAHLSVFPAWLGVSFGPPSVPLGSLYIQRSDVRFLLYE